MYIDDLFGRTREKLKFLKNNFWKVLNGEEEEIKEIEADRNQEEVQELLTWR